MVLLRGVATSSTPTTRGCDLIWKMVFASVIKESREEMILDLGWTLPAMTSGLRRHRHRKRPYGGTDWSGEATSKGYLELKAARQDPPIQLAGTIAAHGARWLQKAGTLPIP